MPSTPRALVIQNTRTGRPRRLGDWLESDGLSLDVAAPFDGTPLPQKLEHDAFIVLGGGFMPTDDERAPWLPQARELAAQAIETSTPMLGICLGGQLLAHIAGGVVRANSGRMETGSTLIQLREEAATDPLFHGMPATVTAIEHHQDSIEVLPPDATWLGASEVCAVQAFRIGVAAWGTQFHPEISGDEVATWSFDGPLERGVNKFDVVRTAQADEPTSAPVWRELARRFAALVTAGSR